MRGAYDLRIIRGRFDLTESVDTAIHTSGRGGAGLEGEWGGERMRLSVCM